MQHGVLIIIKTLSLAYKLQLVLYFNLAQSLAWRDYILFKNNYRLSAIPNNWYKVWYKPLKCRSDNTYTTKQDFTKPTINPYSRYNSGVSQLSLHCANYSNFLITKDYFYYRWFFCEVLTCYKHLLMFLDIYSSLSIFYTIRFKGLLGAAVASAKPSKQVFLLNIAKL